jgi:hypothetical protein
MCFNMFQSNIDYAMVDRVNELTIEEIKYEGFHEFLFLIV